MTPVVVRRSAIKMWLLAILGVPFVLFGVDVLLRQRFVGTILELIHPNGDAPAVETRDLIWAWMYVLVGGALVVWALKELTLPRKLIEADRESLILRLGRPFAPAAIIPLTDVHEVSVARASADGDVFPVLIIAFREGASPAGLPPAPWGARWLDPDRLAVAARDWDTPADRVAEQLRSLTEAAAAEPGGTGAGHVPTSGEAAAREDGTAETPVRVDGGEHWSTLAPPAEDETPARTLAPELPASRFVTSHWIILDEGEG